MLFPHQEQRIPSAWVLDYVKQFRPHREYDQLNRFDFADLSAVLAAYPLLFQLKVCSDWSQVGSQELSPGLLGGLFHLAWNAQRLLASDSQLLEKGSGWESQKLAATEQKFTVEVCNNFRIYDISGEGVSPVMRILFRLMPIRIREKNSVNLSVAASGRNLTTMSRVERTGELRELYRCRLSCESLLGCGIEFTNFSLVTLADPGAVDIGDNKSLTYPVLLGSSTPNRTYRYL